MKPDRRNSTFRAFRLGLNLSLTQGLRQHLRFRKVLIGLIALLLLVVVQVILVRSDRAHHPAVDAFTVFTGIMALNLILPFLSLITALGLLGGELEQGTLVYYLVRPCPRLAILLGRILSAALVTGLVQAVLILGCLIAVRATASMDPDVRPPLPPLDLALHLATVGLVGAWVFTTLYAALALLVRRPIIALLLGVGHALVWESIIAFLPGTISEYTFTQNLHALFFDHEIIGRWPRKVLFQDLHTAPPVGDAWMFLLGCSVLFVLLAWYRFRGREITPEA
jgi:ABC-type transport system involved in multi-copper enzyme maturation permease subunit